MESICALSLFEATVLRNRNLIANGTFGQIYLCDTTCGDRKYIVKAIRKSKTQAILQSMGSSVKAEDEAMYHWQFVNANILECIAIEETMDTILFVFPYMHMGNAMNAILHYGAFTFDKMHELYSNIYGALSYIHQQKITHRDVKLENILLRKKLDSETMGYCLTDFGFAKMACDLAGCSTFIGTAIYMAPEIYLCRCYGSEYGMRADLWSLGISLFILASATHPFFEEDLEHQICDVDIVFDENQWSRLPKTTFVAITTMLRKCPSERLCLPL